MPRALLVSNRLPITVRGDHGEVSITRSSGGLATALRGPHERRGASWIGWPGDVSRLSAAQRAAVDVELRSLGTVPVYLGASEVHRYYDGFSNGVLWPLFHYLLDKVNLDARSDWEAYRDVNERFAAAVVAEWRPGDVVWVHDYQLMLVPEIVRRRLPDARIGFFLHTPFPAAEVFRILPWREEILRGLLGADLIGFHADSYRHHFAYAVALLLAIEGDADSITHEGRTITLGVHPIGIDTAVFDRLAADPAVGAEAQRIRAEAGGRKIVLGIDRLDYTKGIPRRLLAIERLLEREPALRQGLRFIQLAVPTRDKVDAYATFRRTVDELVGRINGRFGSATAQPIHYLYRALSMEQVVALFLAADVMLVTPLRDGMNLVAKEYVACRRDDTGVLVLSEFAGAAAELGEALHVNPYDIDAVASTIKRALQLPAREQRVRMRALRRRVAATDVHRWADRFLDELAPADAPPWSGTRRIVVEPPVIPEGVAPTLILDYDGTLVPLAALPELAPPDDELLDLLRDLVDRAGAEVHIVSGRPLEDLERWLGALPIALHAEHGFWSRSSTSRAWLPLAAFETSWKPELRAILAAFTERTFGSFVEEKTVTMAWHYRASEPQLARERRRELCAAVEALLREHDLELLAGAKVLEIRPRGVDKGRAVPRIITGERDNIVAIGDDRTDEDLFAALPAAALTIHVGPGASRAAHRLADPAGVRRFLRSLVPA